MDKCGNFYLLLFMFIFLSFTKYGKIILKDGTKYYNRTELHDGDFNFIETAVNVALEQIKIKNKKKYTPNKFKK